MIQRFVRTFGAVYLVVGILGFIPGALRPAAPDPDLAVHASHGLLLGLFPVNAVHNLVHIAVGIWGLAAGRDASSAVFYARAMAITFGALTILGLLPFTDTLFGLSPLHGHDVWLHALTAALTGYFGFSEHRGTTAVRHAV